MLCPTREKRARQKCRKSSLKLCIDLQHQAPWQECPVMPHPASVQELPCPRGVSHRGSHLTDGYPSAETPLGSSQSVGNKWHLVISIKQRFLVYFSAWCKSAVQGLEGERRREGNQTIALCQLNIQISSRTQLGMGLCQCCLKGLQSLVTQCFSRRWKDHRMAEIGKDLWRSSHQHSSSKQCQPQLVAQDHYSEPCPVCF